MKKATKKLAEKFMTIAAAKSFVADVMALVEKEGPTYMDIQTWQHRMGGQVWSEGFKVDLSHELNFSDAYGMHYYVSCHEDDVACIRKNIIKYGQTYTDMPFFGTVREAADWIINEYKRIWED